jgi:prepilin signal peptidase PulO-like enzyme (type II secretory pathway)
MSAEAVPAPAAEERQSTTTTIRPVTYAGAAVAVVLSLLVFGFSGDAVVASVFSAALVVIAASDLESRIIPNRIVLPASGLVLLLNIAIHPSDTFQWVGAAAAAFGFFFLVALINPAGLGMGDVKLAFLIGAGLGWDVAAALILGTFASAVYAVFLVLTRPGTGAKTAFALGPFLAGAGLFVLYLAH